MYPLTLCQTFQPESWSSHVCEVQAHSGCDRTDRLFNKYNWSLTLAADTGCAVFSVITVHTRECDSWVSFNSPFSWLCNRVATQCWKEGNNCTPNVKTWFTFLILCYLISIWSYTSRSASFSTTQIQILISVFLSLIKLSRHIIFTCNVIKLPHLGS